MASVSRASTGRSSQFNEIFAANRVVDSSGAGTDLTIQAALDNLPAEGGTVFIRQGTYSITSTLTVPVKPVRIIGAGRDATRIDLGANAIAAFTYAGGGLQCIEDLNIKGGNVAGQIFVAGLANVVVKNVDVGVSGGGEVEKFVRATNIFDIKGYNITFAPKASTGYVLEATAPGAISAELHNFTQGTGVPTVLAYGAGASKPHIRAYDCTFALTSSTASNAGYVWLNNCYLQGPVAGPVATLTTKQTRMVNCTVLTTTHEVTEGPCAISGTTYGNAYAGNLIRLTTSVLDARIVGCSFSGDVDPGIYIDRGGTFISNCYFQGAAARHIDITANGANANINGCHFLTNYTSEAVRTAASTGTFVGNTNCKVLETGAADYNYYSDNAGFSGSTIIGANCRYDAVQAGVSTLLAEGVGKANLNTTAVGNVDAGEDNLITYSLPANALYKTAAAVRITAWGTAANNGNAKTLKMYFGTQLILAYSLTASQAGLWEIVAIVGKTGSNTQDYHARLLEAPNDQIDIEQGTGAETDTAAITIKCTGEATATNDIVQEGMLVELMN